MPTLETHNGYPLWRYIPNRPAACAFTAIFVILTIAHTWRMFRHRMWFCIPFVIGGIFESIGYIGRAISYDATGELPPYIMQSTLLLLGPVLFAASLYMTMSRVIQAAGGDHCSLVRPRWLTRIFVTGDVFSFLLQGSGAGLLVQAGSGSVNPDMGNNIIIGGLIFQVVIFAFFIAVGLVFNIRFRKDDASSVYSHIPWQQNLNMLYATSALILLRNVFRVVEYAMGSDGYLLSTEWPIYVFDAALMAITMAWFLWRYPSGLKQERRHAIASSDSKDIPLV